MPARRCRRRTARASRRFSLATAPVTHDFFWWYHLGNRALRVKDWKIVACKDGPWESYDLAKDRSETRDLASKQADRVRELQRVWEKCAIVFAPWRMVRTLLPRRDRTT